MVELVCVSLAFVAQRIAESFDKSFLIEGRELFIRPSVGLAIAGVDVGNFVHGVLDCVSKSLKDSGELKTLTKKDLTVDPSTLKVIPIIKVPAP